MVMSHSSSEESLPLPTHTYLLAVWPCLFAFIGAGHLTYGQISSLILRTTHPLLKPPHQRTNWDQVVVLFLAFFLPLGLSLHAGTLDEN